MKKKDSVDLYMDERIILKGIKMWNSVDLIHLDQGRKQERIILNTVINLLIS
jgi:hypothetical protein